VGVLFTLFADYWNIMITQINFHYIFHYMELTCFVKSVSNKRKPPSMLGIKYHQLQQ